MTSLDASQQTPSLSRPVPTRAFALKLAGIYALVAGLWIYASSGLLYALVRDHELHSALEKLKGWFFVAVTSFILGWALDRYFRQIRQASRLLQESEQRWLFALDGAGDGVWDWDVARQRVFYSTGWKAMLGYAPEEIADTVAEWESRVHPEDLSRVREELQAHLEGRSSSYSSEHRIRCKDGSYKWILDRGKVMNRRPDGQPLRVIGTHADITERKLAERITRQWADAFEHCAHGLALGISGTNRTLACNPALARMLGRSAEALQGEDILRLYAPEDHEIIRRNIAEADRTGQSHYEARMLRADGSQFPAQMDVVSVHDANGEPSYRVATIQDITLRNAAKVALEQEAIWRRLLVEQSRDGIVVIDEQGKVVEANRSFADMLGYSLEEVQQLHVWDWDRQWSREELLDIIRQVDTDRFETRQRRKDGTTIEVEISSNGTTLGGRKLIFCVCRDISQRKQAEQALMASEERFRMVVNAAPLAIFIRTGDFFTYANPASAKLFGASTPDELIGTSVVERFHPNCRPQILERMRRLDRLGEQTTFTKQVFVRMDGSEVQVVASAVPFIFQSQRASLVYAQDVSEERRLEAQLRQAQKLEAIGQLAGGVAHDFNNQLAAIMMHLGLLKMNTQLDADTLGGLKELEGAAQRAASLTRQLLMFGRRSVLSVKPLSLNDVVANLLKMLSRLISEQIQLRFNGRTALPLVNADAGMMDQVIMNLVVNARDAIAGDGHITIETSTVHFNPDDLGNQHDRKAGHFVCLAVSDSGCGMDACTQKRIFEPFFTTKEVGRGSGLGLATVHGIIAQHGGWIEVQSAPGQGAKFSLYLPVFTPASSEIQNTPEQAPMRFGKETVLVVEDETRVRRMISQSLRVLGYRVHEASNGQEALELWQNHADQMDLLLTDMVMPEGVSGLELADRLQSEKSDLKVILSSGYSSEIVEAGVPTRPGTRFLAKPYPIESLARLMRECLDNQPGGSSDE